MKLFHKQLIHMNFLECVDAQNLEDFVEILWQIELLFQDGDQHINAHGDPDLCLHRVGRGAEKALDVQILFDPFEEQLDLPAAFVELGDSQRRQREVVGQVDEEPLRLGIEKPNAPQAVWISLLAVVDRQTDDLIGTQPRGADPPATNAHGQTARNVWRG